MPYDMFDGKAQDTDMDVAASAVGATTPIVPNSTATNNRHLRMDANGCTPFPPASPL
ncbi:MAG: hypothetical protein M9961_16485 [Ilumatobacteraceae bacterium]|nr:hypothetical protein [Ilumatobacter sp.]MCO5331670.1 hypothetical protein [Ilumatobacteraceae bacterium]